MDNDSSRVSKLLEIVELSKSPDVDLLTEEKLDRCFKWAEYFQKVYKHACEDEAIMTTFGRQLRLMDASKLHLFGEQPLNLHTLNKSASILYDNFLSNKHFPPALLVSLVSKLQSSTNDDDDSGGFSPAFIERIGQAVHERAVWRHVSVAGGNLTCSGQTALLLEKLKVENDANFLRKSLESGVRMVDVEKAASSSKYRQRHVEMTGKIFDKLRLDGRERESEALEVALTSLTDVCDPPYDCYVADDSILFHSFLHWYKRTWCGERQRVVVDITDGMLVRILPHYPLLLECVVDALVFCVERADIEECVLLNTCGRNKLAADTWRKIDLLLTSSELLSDQVNRLFRARCSSMNNSSAIRLGHLLQRHHHHPIHH